MHPDPAYIKKLFIKHANGTITAEETTQLIRFLQREDNEDILPMPDDLEEDSPILMDDAATGRVLQNLAVITAATSTTKHRTILRRIAAVSAAAAAITAAIVLLYHPQQRQPALAAVTTDNGGMKKVTLPDGTTVTLNANTILRYDSVGWRDVREVWIKGQAFFDVAPDAAGKFLVHAGDELAVQVLGTRFNVDATTKDVHVVLNSGKVKVDIPGNNAIQTLILQPGEMATYAPESQLLTRHPADTLQLTCWKDNQKVFRDATLGEIATFIEERFGVKVTFSAPQLSQLQFTGTTPANDLDMLLNILNKSLDIRINKHNNQVMIMLAR
ncbi:MAG TPA: FecR domain-containing protein [Chitinophaga sp.]|uniref:FecR family protein n=1 Tax=Chitinophaga sp. TaxID=1869181 RepID=UPI002B9B0A88|nr:FecR domain-containing protein [Chitinophaga sp.]HVI46879.1 FecR domain-containing protein [Chitinophaga sp.]